MKLSDFGLAKDVANGETFLKSWVGTLAYAAPEIWEGSPYTYAVDIWSLGVVVLQYTYGLPKPKGGKFNAQDWHRRIAKAALAWESDDLIDLLRDHMLQIKSEKRLPVSMCLARALRFVTMPEDSSQPGSPGWTPTETASTIPDDRHSVAHEVVTLVNDPRRRPDQRSTLRGTDLAEEILPLSSRSRHPGTPRRGAESSLNRILCGEEVAPSRKRQRLNSVENRVIGYEAITCRKLRSVQGNTRAFTLEVNECKIRMLETEGQLDAMSIMDLAELEGVERKWITGKLKDLWLPQKPYISYGNGSLLCDVLGLSSQLRPLLDHGSASISGIDCGVSRLLSQALTGHHRLHASGHVVYVEKESHLVNYKHMTNAAGVVKNTMLLYIRRERIEVQFISEGGYMLRGNWVGLPDAVKLCLHFGLLDLKKELEDLHEVRHHSN